MVCYLLSKSEVSSGDTKYIYTLLVKDPNPSPQVKMFL